MATRSPARQAGTLDDLWHDDNGGNQDEQPQPAGSSTAAGTGPVPVRAEGTRSLAEIPAERVQPYPGAGTGSVLHPDRGRDRGTDHPPDPAAGPQPGGGGAGPALPGGAGGPDDSAARRGTSGPGRAAAAAGGQQLDPSRFRPATQADLAPSGAAARITANIAALRTLRDIQAQDRAATAAEQQVLARWGGFGAVPQIFDDDREDLASQRAQIRELTTDEEYAALRHATLNAHYTDASYVHAIWDALAGLGFAGGQVLDPGCGSGTFFGCAPDTAQLTGVELCPVTAAITAVLYRGAVIRAESFAHSRFPSGSFDAVVGNVPFSRTRLRDDTDNPGRLLPVHDHFLVKAARLTRPGGLIVALTSRYTMDRQNPDTRRRLAEHADLVAAIRLPGTAHARAAGTKIVTDLLILRRRPPGEAPAPAPGTGRWEQALPVNVPGGQQHMVNTYFHDNPGHVLGTMRAGHGEGGRPELDVVFRGDIAAALRAALTAVTGTARQAGLVMTARPAAAPSPAAPPPAGLPPELIPGMILARDDGTFTRVTQVRGGEATQVPYRPPRTQAAELRHLLRLRDTTLALLRAEQATLDDTGEIDTLRARLGTQYGSYVKQYGPVKRFTWGKPRRRRAPAAEPEELTAAEAAEEEAEEELTAAPRLMAPQGGFRKDPLYPVVYALEGAYDPVTRTAPRADIFTGRVIVPDPPLLGADTAGEALAICLSAYGEVRLDVIARLLGVPDPGQARALLGTEVFDDPLQGGRPVWAPLYLSGDVRQKVAAAEAAAGMDPQRYEPNVTALRQVLPRDWGPAEIEAQLGAGWIDPAVIEQFARDLLADRTQVWLTSAGSWDVSGGDRSSTRAIKTWGTSRMCAQDLLKRLLRGTAEQILLRTGGKDNPPDIPASSAARQKSRDIAARFAQWVWEDPDRAAALAAAYNTRMNSRVPVSFDNVTLHLPGLSPLITLRRHQPSAIARIIYQGAAGLVHDTGAGKTLESVIGVRERCRLGLSTKPCFVVQKHKLGDFRDEWLRAYPGARLIVADTDDLEGDKRREFVARCATSRPEAIIISREAFTKIPVSFARQEQFARHEAALLAQTLAQAQADEQNEKDRGSKRARKRTIKQIEQMMSTARERVADLAASIGHDKGLTYEDTGIDYLVIDEADGYRRGIITSGLPGETSNGSDRSRDLLLKIGHHMDRHGQARSCLMTATPWDNRIAEIYTWLSLLGEHAGPYDGWLRTIAKMTVAYEMTPAGQFKARARVREIINAPDLYLALRQVSDFKLHGDGSLDLKLPVMQGGRPQIMTVPATEAHLGHAAELKYRLEHLPGGPPEKGKDNYLKIQNEAIMAALDVRMIGLAPTGPQKSDVTADVIHKKWLAHRDDIYRQDDGTEHPVRGSLIQVFASLGTPTGRGWNFYEEVRRLLVAKGMPRHLIRFIHEARDMRSRDEMFHAARNGGIHVLIGSTSKLGTGTNVQDRAVGLIQVTAPWNWNEPHQEIGRVQREGNQNPEFWCIRIGTEPSCDSLKWERARQKENAFRPLMTGKIEGRTIRVPDDDLTAAEMMAATSGDMRLLEYARLEAEAAHLSGVRSEWAREQTGLARRAADTRKRIEQLETFTSRLQDAITRRQDTRGPAFAMTVDGRRYTTRADAADALTQFIMRCAADPAVGTGAGNFARWPAGQIGGFLVTLEIDRPWVILDIARPAARLLTPDLPATRDPEWLDLPGPDDKPLTGLITQLENRLRRMEHDLTETGQTITTLRKEAAAEAEEQASSRFSQQEELDQVHARLAELELELFPVAETATGPSEEAPVSSSQPSGTSDTSADEEDRQTGTEPAIPAPGARREQPPPGSQPGDPPGSVLAAPEPADITPGWAPDSPYTAAITALAQAAAADTLLIQQARANHFDTFMQVLSSWVDDHVAATLPEHRDPPPFTEAFFTDPVLAADLTHCLGAALHGAVRGRPVPDGPGGIPDPVTEKALEHWCLSDEGTGTAARQRDQDTTPGAWRDLDGLREAAQIDIWMSRLGVPRHSRSVRGDPAGYSAVTWCPDEQQYHLRVTGPPGSRLDVRPAGGTDLVTLDARRSQPARHVARAFTSYLGAKAGLQIPPGTPDQEQHRAGQDEDMPATTAPAIEPAQETPASHSRPSGSSTTRPEEGQRPGAAPGRPASGPGAPGDPGLLPAWTAASPHTRLITAMYQAAAADIPLTGAAQANTSGNFMHLIPGWVAKFTARMLTANPEDPENAAFARAVFDDPVFAADLGHALGAALHAACGGPDAVSPRDQVPAAVIGAALGHWASQDDTTRDILRSPQHPAGQADLETAAQIDIWLSRVGQPRQGRLVRWLATGPCAVIELPGGGERWQLRIPGPGDLTGKYKVTRTGYHGWWLLNGTTPQQAAEMLTAAIREDNRLAAPPAISLARSGSGGAADGGEDEPRAELGHAATEPAGSRASAPPDAQPGQDWDILAMAARHNLTATAGGDGIRLHTRQDNPDRYLLLLEPGGRLLNRPGRLIPQGKAGAYLGACAATPRAGHDDHYAALFPAAAGERAFPAGYPHHVRDDAAGRSRDTGQPCYVYADGRAYVSTSSKPAAAHLSVTSGGQWASHIGGTVTALVGAPDPHVLSEIAGESASQTATAGDQPGQASPGDGAGAGDRDPRSSARPGPDAPAAQQTEPAPGTLLIEHGPAGTAVKGTSQADTALHRLLGRDGCGFTYSRNQGLWYLPRPWSFSTRDARVRQLTTGLTRLGRQYTLADNSVTSVTAGAAGPPAVAIPAGEPYPSARAAATACRAVHGEYWQATRTDAGRRLIYAHGDALRPDVAALKAAMKDLDTATRAGGDEPPGGMAGLADLMAACARAGHTLAANLRAEHRQGPKMYRHLDQMTTLAATAAGRLTATAGLTAAGSAGPEHGPSTGAPPAGEQAPGAGPSPGAEPEASMTMLEELAALHGLTVQPSPHAPGFRSVMDGTRTVLLQGDGLGTKVGGIWLADGDIPAYLAAYRTWPGLPPPALAAAIAPSGVQPPLTLTAARALAARHGLQAVPAHGGGRPFITIFEPGFAAWPVLSWEPGSPAASAGPVTVPAAAVDAWLAAYRHAVPGPPRSAEHVLLAPYLIEGTTLTSARVQDAVQAGDLRRADDAAGPYTPGPYREAVLTRTTSDIAGRYHQMTGDGPRYAAEVAKAAHREWDWVYAWARVQPGMLDTVPDPEQIQHRDRDEREQAVAAAKEKSRRAKAALDAGDQDGALALIDDAETLDPACGHTWQRARDLISNGSAAEQDTVAAGTGTPGPEDTIAQPAAPAAGTPAPGPDPGAGSPEPATDQQSPRSSPAPPEPAVSSIARIWLLHGHDSPETAYVVEDYPASFSLRCKARYWLETAAKGQYCGMTRMERQTTDPRAGTEIWNKPHASTYASFMVLYLDENEHVQTLTGQLPWGWRGEEDARMRLQGVYAQLTGPERDLYDRLARAGQKGGSWNSWEKASQYAAGYYARHGQMPSPEQVRDEPGFHLDDGHYDTLITCTAAAAQTPGTGGHPASTDPPARPPHSEDTGHALAVTRPGPPAVPQTSQSQPVPAASGGTGLVPGASQDAPADTPDDRTGTSSAQGEAPDGPAEPEPVPVSPAAVTGSDLAIALHDLDPWNLLQIITTGSCRAGAATTRGPGQPDPGAVQQVTWGGLGVSITVTGPGVHRHGILSWQQARQWLRPGLTGARTGILATAIRLRAACGRRTAAGTISPGTGTGLQDELTGIRDTTITAMISDALARCDPAAPFPATPRSPAQPAPDLLPRPSQDATPEDNTALARLLRIQETISGSRQPDPHQVTLAARWLIGDDLPGYIRAIDRPAAMGEWISKQRATVADSWRITPAKSGQWHAATPAGLMTTDGHDDGTGPAPALIVWEELPGWIGPALDPATRRQLLDADDQARQITGPPGSRQARQVARQLQNAITSAWIRIGTAPQPSPASLNQAIATYTYAAIQASKRDQDAAAAQASRTGPAPAAAPPPAAGPAGPEQATEPGENRGVAAAPDPAAPPGQPGDSGSPDAALYQDGQALAVEQHPSRAGEDQMPQAASTSPPARQEAERALQAAQPAPELTPPAASPAGAQQPDQAAGPGTNSPASDSQAETGAAKLPSTSTARPRAPDTPHMQPEPGPGGEDPAGQPAPEPGAGERAGASPAAGHEPGHIGPAAQGRTPARSKTRSHDPGKDGKDAPGPDTTAGPDNITAPPAPARAAARLRAAENGTAAASAPASDTTRTSPGDDARPGQDGNRGPARDPQPAPQQTGHDHPAQDGAVSTQPPEKETPPMSTIEPARADTTTPAAAADPAPDPAEAAAPLAHRMPGQALTAARLDDASDAISTYLADQAAADAITGRNPDTTDVVQESDRQFFDRLDRDLEQERAAWQELDDELAQGRLRRRAELERIAAAAAGGTIPPGQERAGNLGHGLTDLLAEIEQINQRLTRHEQQLLAGIEQINERLVRHENGHPAKTTAPSRRPPAPLDRETRAANAFNRWLDDTPDREWQRISTACAAAGATLTVLRDQAGSWWGDVREDIRVYGVLRTVAARACRTVAGLAAQLAARLDGKIPAPAVTALNRLAQAARDTAHHLMTTGAPGRVTRLLTQPDEVPATASPAGPDQGLVQARAGTSRRLREEQPASRQIGGAGTPPVRPPAHVA